VTHIAPCRRVAGTLEVPGDKSLSHRMLIFGALARGNTEVSNLSPGQDVARTLRAMKDLGARIKTKDDHLRIQGREGLLVEPKAPLNCGNSGTSARLLAGILASQPFFSMLYGDGSLQKRPMKRVVHPLREMGARVFGPEEGSRLPLAIQGGALEGKDHRLEVASAQVKSALLLAGLKAEGVTRVIEPSPSRDHSERLMKWMGAELETNGRKVSIKPGVLQGVCYDIPGDFSSAAFFIALGLLHPKAEIEVRSVNLNPTRTGFLDVAKKMGGEIEVEVVKQEPEPVGTVRVRSSSQKGISVEPEVIPTMIDEVPLLVLVATQAFGRTVIRGAGELRKKESDRIAATVATLKAFGAKIEELEDGFEVEGPTPLKIAKGLSAHGDHRIVMLQAIAGALSREGVALEGEEWVKISYPGFFADLARLTKR
jgi:3-phosphoshikimate 1-carboxyvinyltransferase